jgi:hypothetical protein
MASLIPTRTSFRALRARYALALLGLLLVLPSTSSAQTSTNGGLRSSGRDFYIGYMPGLRHPSSWSGIDEQLNVLVGSLQDNNTFTVSYFDNSGHEFGGRQVTLQKGEVNQFPLDRLQLMPTKQGERAEYKSAHITSRYPVTVQVLQEGSSTGGMYQAIPTNALGKDYVAACWYDNPLENNPGYLNRDSASSQFMIIAAYDDTHVTYIPNATTYGGVIGNTTGRGATGKPNPTTVTLRRGQIFWVRSQAVDITNDMSGSQIRSDKPIAVLAGHERALLGDPSGYWTTLDNDVRDILIEQMTPVDDWGSDYPSVPFLPPPSIARLLANGAGDMYRIYTNQPSGGVMNMWTDPTAPQKYSRSVSAYQSPTASFDNVEQAVDLLVNSTNPDGTPKKMYVVMYDYFQGQHDFDDGGSTSQKGGKGPQDEMTMVCPNEMNVIPIDRFGLNTVFKVPQRSTYRGYQFINLITNRDSVNKINVIYNRQSPKLLSSYSKRKQYEIPLHPELIGLTYQLAPGDYLIYGNTPFACYSYGRTETQYKDGWGYAAPCGEIYGSRSELLKPKVQIIPNCDHWDIRVTDPRPTDEGIAEIMLLHDADGFYSHPGHDSYNTTMNPETPSFMPGDTAVSFQVLINDATKDAYAAVYIVDRAGNDTVIQLNYKAQTFPLSASALAFGKQIVGDQVCQTIVVHTAQTGAADTALIDKATFKLKDGSFSFTTKPALPLTVRAGDSVVFTVCFDSKDTLSHIDTLELSLGCTTADVPVTGSGGTPIILADDWDFGVVTVGDTVCHEITVRNVGNADLVLDKNWLLHNTKEFSFPDTLGLPITIKPGGSVKLTFCFHPEKLGDYDTRQDWGTNIRPPYEHQKKDFSLLRGGAVQPGLNWDRPDQGYTVECDDTLVVRVNLQNPSSGANGTDINVTHVYIEGPDAAEFTITNNEMGYLPIENVPPWPLEKNGKRWIDVKFQANTTKGYTTRHANLIAIGTDAANVEYSDTLMLIGNVRHQQLTINPASYEFGLQVPGTKVQEKVVITNVGDTDAVVKDLLSTGGSFAILSGPSIGSTLSPGQSDTFVVEFTAPNLGDSSFSLTVSCSTDCGNQVLTAAKGSGASIKVAGTDVPFGTIYICQNGALQATTTNEGVNNAILVSVELREIPGSNELGQFSFNDGSHFMTVNDTVPGGEIKRYMVRYNPAHNGLAKVQVIYTWIDPIQGDTQRIIREVTGFGYKTDNVVSLANPVAGFYTVSTENLVTIPVQLTKPFDSIAQIYGVQLTVRYLRDQFIFDPGKLAVDPQLSLVGSASPVADPADNNYELLTLKFASQNGKQIENVNVLAQLTWEYVVARDSNTSFEIRDLMFLDKTGATVCWVDQSMIPGQFYGTNRCADFTLRQYLRTNTLVVSIDHIVPNPVHATTRIDYRVNENMTPVTIDVFNALGDKVATLVDGEVQAQGGYQRTFDAQKLPSGIYTIRVSTPNYQATKSILVTK